MGELTVDALKNGEVFEITVKVKNTGARKGKETVQLYIHDLLASYIRQQKKLKGFRKIEPEVGEEKEVTFEPGYGEPGFFDARGKYLVECGEFEIFVGDSCTTNNCIKIQIV